MKPLLMRSVRIAPVIVVAASLAVVDRAGLTAQTQSDRVFRAGVDFVRVDAVVTDGSDRPMTGLTAADFEIRENGKPQRITDFRYVSVPLAHQHFSAGAGSDGASPPPPSDVATNAPTSPNSRLFVLIVDNLHLVESVIVPVQRIMTEFINNLSPDDEVAVLFVSRSDLSQNFTHDSTRLLKTVASVRSAFGFGIGVYQDEQVEELPYARDVAWQLKNVAEALAHSGYARRAIVFIGAFSQLDPAALIGTTELQHAQMLQLYLNDAFDAARRADVPIYTVDPRGIPDDHNAITPRNPHVIINPNASPNVLIQRAAALPDPQIRPAPTTTDRNRVRIQQEHLAELAINTGGRAFINRSDLLGAMDEIVTENGSFYELGYYASPSVHDGKFHEISVSVTRPGAHVRARPGYVAASAAAEAASPPNLRTTLDAAMGSGLNVSGLTLHAFAVPIAPSPKGARALVTVEVTYPVPLDGSRRIEDDLELGVTALDTDGKVKGTVTRPWRFSGAAPAEGAVTFLVDDVVDVPTQPLTLRIAAASKALGKAGMVQMAIDAMKPASDRLQIDGVVLGFAGPPREAALGFDTIKTLVPFQPTTLRTFDAKDVLRIFAPMTWPAKDGEATVTLTITSGASAIDTRTETVAGLTTSGGRSQESIDVEWPLRQLASGSYRLDVTARAGSGPPASREVPFVIR